MKRIVVVDDQPMVGNIYQTKFTAEGFQVDVALDGQEALKLIERTNPDVLRLRINKPTDPFFSAVHVRCTNMPEKYWRCA